MATKKRLSVRRNSRNAGNSPGKEARCFACPVLALWGGADEGIPAEVVATFERALSEAGVEHRSVTYPDAVHSFFDRHAVEYASASEDAWREMLEFMALPVG